MVWQRYFLQILNFQKAKKEFMKFSEPCNIWREINLQEVVGCSNEYR
jgi:hypothetical protein